jgi:hypothetical protein
LYIKIYYKYIYKNKKNKKKIDCLENKYINIKNLLINPVKGGIPAKDNNKKTKNIEIKDKLPKNFNSFKVLMYFISNIKNIKNIFINKKM